ncbi:hypothetical protein CL619_00760 [archaeon]|nr:hypothetical protein [archaeon]|tara:strand:+ start:2656 stop:3009 length:354 start_codon:yes stop_codon:yes gene_type:complete
MQLNEELLKKIVISGSIIGIVFLYWFAGTITLDPIASLEGIPKDTEVKLTGEVLSVSQTEKVAFISVANQAIKITEVVVFKDHDIWLDSGDYVEIVGTTEEYEGKMELIASTITVLD